MVYKTQRQGDLQPRFYKRGYRSPQGSIVAENRRRLKTRLYKRSSLSIAAFFCLQLRFFKRSYRPRFLQCQTTEEAHDDSVHIKQKQISKGFDALYLYFSQGTVSLVCWMAQYVCNRECIGIFLFELSPSPYWAFFHYNKSMQEASEEEKNLF